MLRWMLFGAIIGTGAMLSGCGYTDLEMAAKQRQIDALVAQVNALKAVPAPTCGGDSRRPAPVAEAPALRSNRRR